MYLFLGRDNDCDDYVLPLLADNNYADVLQYLNAFVASSIDENNDCFYLPLGYVVVTGLRCTHHHQQTDLGTANP